MNPPRPKAPLSRWQDALAAVVTWMAKQRPADVIADAGSPTDTEHSDEMGYR